MSLLPKSIHRCRRYPTKFNSGRDIPGWFIDVSIHQATLDSRQFASCYAPALSSSWSDDAIVNYEPIGGASAINPNRKIFEARKRETAALGAGEKLVLGHPLAATIGDSARCMQNLEKVLFTGPKTSDTVTFICD